MKSLITTCCLFIAVLSSYAQNASFNIIDSWVKTKVVYQNGQPLPDDNLLKYNYMRYRFENDKVEISFNYAVKGTKAAFELRDSVIDIKSSGSYVINSFKIEKCTATQLVLLQKGQSGFNDPDCVRYYFEDEKDYCAHRPIGRNDLIEIKGTDTLFRLSSSVYAIYKDGSFYDYLHSEISEISNVSSTNAHFKATFIVDENGIADSLHIISNINPKFEKQFLKAFNKVRNNWIPAERNGKKVRVQLTQEMNFFSSQSMIRAMACARRAREAMGNEQWSTAIYFFDEALKGYPENEEALYYRAVCKLRTENKDGACQDLAAVKALGSVLADDLIKNLCEQH